MLGLLPPFIAKRLGIVETPETAEQTKTTCCTNSSCPDTNNIENKNDIGKENDNVVTIETAQQFQNITSNQNIVIMKFTAEWCKPCHRIQPTYQALAQQYSSAKKKIKFVVLDVDNDELEDAVSECGATILPTFAAFHHGALQENKMIGSDESSLNSFVKRVIEDSKK